MNKQPDIYVELALRALERVPRFLAGRSLDMPISPMTFVSQRSSAGLTSPAMPSDSCGSSTLRFLRGFRMARSSWLSAMCLRTATQRWITDECMTLRPGR